MENFDYKKAVQALVFFCLKEKDEKINKIKALKLLFFAERYHIRKYNRLITNDSYWAMGMGPVASGTKDLIDSSAWGSDKGKTYSQKYIHKESDHFISAKGNPDFDVFSESDIEALEFAWEKFGGFDYPEIIKVTHDYPEWEKHSAALEKEGVDRVKINIFDFLEDPPKDIERCYELTPEDKSAIIEYLKEQQTVDDLWN